MKRACSLIFWGLLVVLIDIRIAFIDVLPDFIGYVFVLTGLAKLRSLNSGFKLAWIAAWIQFVLSFLPLIGIRAEISLTGGEPSTIGTLGFAALAAAVGLIFYYGVCEGIRTVALERGRAPLASSARRLWYWSFAIEALWLFSLPYQLNYGQGDMLPVIFLLAIASLLTMVLLIFLVRRAGREIG